jgi:hypothetical protein
MQFDGNLLFVTHGAHASRQSGTLALWTFLREMSGVRVRRARGATFHMVSGQRDQPPKAVQEGTPDQVLSGYRHQPFVVTDHECEQLTQCSAISRRSCWPRTVPIPLSVPTRWHFGHSFGYSRGGGVWEGVRSSTLRLYWERGASAIQESTPLAVD